MSENATLELVRLRRRVRQMCIDDVLQVGDWRVERHHPYFPEQADVYRVTQHGELAREFQRDSWNNLSQLVALVASFLFEQGARADQAHLHIGALLLGGLPTKACKSGEDCVHPLGAELPALPLYFLTQNGRLQRLCRACNSAYHARYYSRYETPEQRAERKARWYKENKARIQEQHARYRQRRESA